MNYRKLLLGGLALISIVSLASAITTNSSTNQTYEITPSESIKVDYGLLDKPDSNATITVESYTILGTNELEASPDFLNNNFSYADTVTFNIFASKNLSEGSYQLQTTFKEHSNNSTNTSTESINLSYEKDFKQFFEASVREGDRIEFENFNLTVDETSNESLHLEGEGVDLEGCSNLTSDNCTFQNSGENYIFYGIDPGNETSLFSIKSTMSQEIQVIEPRAVEVRKSYPDEEIERGKETVFETYDTRTGQNVGNVALAMYHDNRSDGKIFSQSSDSEGFFTVKIPAEYPTKYLNWDITVVNDQGQIKGSGRFNVTSYDKFYNDSRLKLRELPENTTIGDKVQGRAVNYNNRSKDVSIIIDYPEGRLSASPDETGSFEFIVPTSIETNETLSVRAIRDNREFSFLDSETKEIRVIGDTDGDRMPDDEDRCKSESGIPSNQGCPEREVDVELREWIADGSLGDKVSEWEMKPETEYQLVFVDSETGDILTNITGSANIVDETEDSIGHSAEVENGRLNVSFSDYGGHKLNMDTPQGYTEVSQQFYVEAAEGGNNLYLILGVLVVLAVGAIAHFRGEGLQAFTKIWSSRIPDSFSEPEEDELDTGNHEDESQG